MLAWVIGVALIPIDAKLEKGGQHLAQVLRTHTSQVYAAALLAILGAVLLAGFFAVLTRLVPEGHPGWGLLHRALRWPATKAAIAYLAASDLTRPRLQGAKLHHHGQVVADCPPLSDAPAHEPVGEGGVSGVDAGGNVEAPERPAY
jgi:hypothetical protein